MTDKKQVIFDIERCICHVPDACRDCSHYDHGETIGCMEELLTDALVLLKEQEDQIKNRDESLEKAREEIKWLRGMLKEQEAVVRCKDCKNVCFCDTTEIIPYIPVFAKCTLTDEAHDPDWFGADGERKVGEA